MRSFLAAVSQATIDSAESIWLYVDEDCASHDVQSLCGAPITELTLDCLHFADVPHLTSLPRLNKVVATSLAIPADFDALALEWRPSAACRAVWDGILCCSTIEGVLGDEDEETFQARHPGAAGVDSAQFSAQAFELQSVAISFPEGEPTDTSEWERIERMRAKWRWIREHCRNPDDCT